MEPITDTEQTPDIAAIQAAGVSTGPKLMPENHSAPQAQAPAPGQYVVFDTLARNGVPRAHEIITRVYDDGRDPDTKVYHLRSDVGTPMPMDHALKFLSDKAFRVQNPLGTMIVPPPKQEGGLGGFQLADNQTIADWSELSKPALFKRCKVIAGGEHIKATDSEQAMIDFLLRQRKMVRGERQMDDAALKMASGDLAGAASKQEVEGMYPRSPLIDQVNRR